MMMRRRSKLTNTPLIHEDLKSVLPLMRFHCPLPSCRDVGWMLAIGLLGLGLRLLDATEYIVHPLGRLLWVDEVMYWQRV